MSYRVQKVRGGYVLHGAGTAWTISEESYDAITEYLQQPKPPTPDERAIKLHKLIIAETGVTFSPKVENWISREIQEAIDADREARQ